MNDQPLERIAAALERIADSMDAAKVLEERRAKDRSRKRSAGRHSAEFPRKERNEEAKEGKSPHTPLKGESEEEKKDPPQRGRAREDGFDALFERFWQAYPGPRKTDKRKCRAKFAAILRESDQPEAMLQRILDGIDRWRKTRDWTDDNGDYICAPLVWLNNGRWDAEVEPAKPRTSSPDPKAAAFERQRAEAEERKRRAAELARALDAKGGAQ